LILISILIRRRGQDLVRPPVPGALAGMEVTTLTPQLARNSASDEGLLPC
jgi:hypothetical protein